MVYNYSLQKSNEVNQLYYNSWCTLCLFVFDVAVLVAFRLLLGNSGQRKGLSQEACMTLKLVSPLLTC